MREVSERTELESSQLTEDEQQDRSDDSCVAVVHSWERECIGFSSEVGHAGEERHCERLTSWIPGVSEAEERLREGAHLPQ